MSSPSQYGHPFFLNDLNSPDSARRLTRLHFAKNGATPSRYDERWLQDLIARHPSLLPLEQIEPAFTSLVPVCVELPTKSGYVDNLFVTPHGDLALVECKLWRNPEARREVVGQIIDYAKELASWDYDALQDAINHTRPLTAEHATRKLYDLVAAAQAEIDEASFHDNVARNLERGRFLLLIVGDGIRGSVQSMVEFLQQHAGMHFTLALVELALFEVHEGSYIAQPRVLAQTARIDLPAAGYLARGAVQAITTASTNSTPRTPLTEERFFERLDSAVPQVGADLRRLLESLDNFGVSAEFGADTLILRWRPDGLKSWNLATIGTRGQVWLDYLAQQANTAGLIEPFKRYRESLASIVPGAYVKRTEKETGAYVTIDGKAPLCVDVLVSNEENRQRWVSAISEFQKAVQRATG